MLKNVLGHTMPLIVLSVGPPLSSQTTGSAEKIAPVAVGLITLPRLALGHLKAVKT